MKALLLAAGLGTRLRPLTLDVPKCLVPINGRPLLEYWLEMIFNAGFGSVLLNLHHLPEKVRLFIENSPYKDRVTLVYEKQLLGTAGTLFHNREFFGNDRILLVHADNFSVFNMDAFVRSHQCRPKGCEMTMMTFRTDSPQSCGIVELDKNNVVQGFHEKVMDPPGELANGAVYLLEPSIFDFLKTIKQDEMDFSKHVLPRFIGKIYTFHNDQYHRDIGTLDSYNKAQERL